MKIFATVAVTVLASAATGVFGFDKIMIGTGRSGEKDIELVKFPNAGSSTTCVKPTDYPIPTEGSVGAMIDGVPVLCGGANDQVSFNDCFHYDKDTGGIWFFFDYMRENRGFAAATTTNQGFYITGGSATGGAPTDTTEIYAAGQFKPSKPLPYSVSRHCVVAFSDGDTIFVGGGDTGLESSTKTAYVFKLSGSDDDVDQIDMGFARSRPACGMTTNAIVVAGGNDASSEPMTSVELLDLLTLKWSIGPPLPEPRAGAQLVDNDGQLYLVGGGSAQILRFTPDAWVVEGEQLQVADRSSFVAIGVNDDQLYECSQQSSFSSSPYASLQDLPHKV